MVQRSACFLVVILYALLENRIVSTFSSPLHIPFSNVDRLSFVNLVTGKPSPFCFSKFGLNIRKIVAIGLQGFTDLLWCQLMQALNPAYGKFFILLHFFDIEKMEYIFFQCIIESSNFDFKGNSCHGWGSQQAQEKKKD